MRLTTEQGAELCHQLRMHGIYKTDDHISERGLAQVRGMIAQHANDGRLTHDESLALSAFAVEMVRP